MPSHASRFLACFYNVHLMAILQSLVGYRKSHRTSTDHDNFCQRHLLGLSNLTTTGVRPKLLSPLRELVRGRKCDLCAVCPDCPWLQNQPLLQRLVYRIGSSFSTVGHAKPAGPSSQAAGVLNRKGSDLS